MTLVDELERRWPAEPPLTTLAVSEVCWRCLQRHAVSVQLEEQLLGRQQAAERRAACGERAGWYWRG